MEVVLPVRESGLHLQEAQRLAGLSELLCGTILGFGPRGLSAEESATPYEQQ
jgi:hypothetical protein